MPDKIYVGNFMDKSDLSVVNPEVIENTHPVNHPSLRLLQLLAPYMSIDSSQDEDYADQTPSHQPNPVNRTLTAEMHRTYDRMHQNRERNQASVRVPAFLRTESERNALSTVRELFGYRPRAKEWRDLYTELIKRESTRNLPRAEKTTIDSISAWVQTHWNMIKDDVRDVIRQIRD